jgi:hypothetical protein
LDKKNLLKSSTEHKKAADVEPSLEHGRHIVKKKNATNSALLDSEQCPCIEKYYL